MRLATQKKKGQLFVCTRERKKEAQATFGFSQRMHRITQKRIKKGSNGRDLFGARKQVQLFLICVAQKLGTFFASSHQKTFYETHHKKLQHVQLRKQPHRISRLILIIANWPKQQSHNKYIHHVLQHMVQRRRHLHKFDN